jgi:hypothetical protein
VSKRYREVLDEVETNEEDTATPASFRWRGRRYRVVRVIGHWREDPGWWRRPDGEPVQILQSDLWRVEARNGRPASDPRGRPDGRCSTQGIYELVHRDDEWRLDKVWD